MIVTVIDSKTGAPIVGALVQFIALMPPTGSDYTDTTGTVTFMPDPIGMSSWTVSAQGYITREGTGTIPEIVELESPEVPSPKKKKRAFTGPFGLWQFPIINMLLGLG
jgi:hypothetical protein